MKRHIVLAALLATTAATPAFAADAKFYGQVGKAITLIDDGEGTGVRVLDLDRASTRFGFTGEQTVGNGLTASFLLEGEIVGETTASTFLNSDDGASGPRYDSPTGGAGTFTERHARVGLSGDFGSVFMGRTSSATDGVTEKDLGNTSLLMGSDIYSLVGGALSVDGNGRTSHAVSFGSIYGNLEGFDHRSDNDRVNLVRYDSPVFNGLQGSAAVANGGDFDVALNYNRKYNSFEVLAGLGYINWNQNTTSAALDGSDAYSGSLAVKFNNGLNFALAGGRLNVVRANVNDGAFHYAKVGYDTGAWGFGIDYGFSGQLGNSATQLDDAESYGAAAQYDFGHGVTAGLSYRNVDISDGVGAANQRNDVDLLTAAFAVKF